MTMGCALIRIQCIGINLIVVLATRATIIHHYNKDIQYHWQI